MRFLFRLRAIVLVATKRLFAQPLLTLATTIGLTVAAALILTVPIYAESMAFRTLQQRLTQRSNQSNRPPFSFMFSYIGSWVDPINIEDIDAVDGYLREQGGPDLGLETQLFIRHLETENFRLYPGSETIYEETSTIDYVTLGTTENIENYIELVEGVLPAASDPAPDSIIDVMIKEDFATEVGIQLDEIYQGFNWRVDASDSQQRLLFRIVGIWRAIDPTNPYWFYAPRVFNDIFLVPYETYVNRISPYRETEVNLGVWYLVSDGGGINTSRVDELVTRHDEVERQVDMLLPSTFVQLTPIDQLKPYQRSVRVLTLLLTIFSVPIVTLLMVFVVMVIGLSVEQRRNETAVLRSRGASPFQIVGLAVIEGFLLGSISLIIGMGAATFITRLLGSARSFMDFSGATEFRVSIPPNIILTIGIVLLFAILIHLIPTISASRHTIVTYKQERARVMKRPFWQRFGLDVLLMALVIYFYYQLVQQGNLFLDQSGGSTALEDAYNNPFMFLLPSATIFAFTLMVLRFFPMLMRFISWILQFTNSVGMLIITRQLERTPGYYYLPSILLVCTIGLGTFTASFARTIDRYLYEQQFYRHAADVAIRVLSHPDAGGSPFSSGGEEEANPVYMHISEFNTIPHIEGATRVGEYGVTARLNSGNVSGLLIGLDRAEFAPVSFWREDFADDRLGTLLNAMAIQNDTVLVSQEFMDKKSLQVGDFLRLDLRVSGAVIPLSLQIVGAIDYFPRWYAEDDGPLFVANLDYVFEQAGFELRHMILARVDSEFDKDDFRMEIVNRGAAGAIIQEPFPMISRIQAQPERQGLFGLLSVGFIASSLVTVLGFFLYTLFSYQRRYVELGILRAIGLSKTSMMFSVAWELSLLIVIGLSLGIGLGLLVSKLYIPYLQFSTTRDSLVPPYVVVVAWAEIAQIIALFFATFVVILAVLLVILRRMRIFQAVKLGEAV